MKSLRPIFFSLSLIASFFINIQAQNQISRIEPPNWWAGMKNPNLQLMIYGDNIGDWNPSIDYPGLRVESVIKVENPNYLFVNLVIGEEPRAGSFQIRFSHNGEIIETHTYELMEREPGSAERKGFDNSDVLYLITPDRFANGHPENDEIAGMREGYNREQMYGRHGGDIEGIRRNLDYIADMGFTAIWLNPVLENDQKSWSYHGYATTDFYKVDRRFGTNEAYRQLSREAKEKGISLIMDMIVNHCGSEHWWMSDLPAPDWVNQWDEYTGTNHRKSLLQDPYASTLDKKIFSDGWFVPTMPDLNQRNPLMATYLLQNSIWWIEFADLAGIRMDTYPYPDMDYMAAWTKGVMEEYPHFNIVGEEWHASPAIVAYWQKGKVNPNGYVSYMPSVMDFPMNMALAKALTAKESWGEGFNNLYETLAMDFLYADPNNLVIFPDNHDMSRIFTQVNEDYGLYKLALTYILTMRGIPQIYYGTEILMSNTGDDSHGNIRSDFPGGWAGDATNGFTGEGLSDGQKEAQNFIKKLLKWRQTATAVHSGKLVHFIPDNGVYVYFRFDENQKVMVVLNKNHKQTTLKMDRFSEITKGVFKGKEVLSGKEYDVSEALNLPSRAPLILELE